MMLFDLNASGRRRRSVSASLLVFLSVALGNAVALLTLVTLS